MLTTEDLPSCPLLRFCDALEAVVTLREARLFVQRNGIGCSLMGALFSDELRHPSRCL